MNTLGLRTKLLLTLATVLFILFLAGESDAGQRLLRTTLRESDGERGTVRWRQNCAVRLLRSTRRGAPALEPRLLQGRQA